MRNMTYGLCLQKWNLLDSPPMWLHYIMLPEWLDLSTEMRVLVPWGQVPFQLPAYWEHSTAQGEAGAIGLAHLVTCPAPGFSPRVCPPIGLSFSLDLPWPSPAATTAGFPASTFLQHHSSTFSNVHSPEAWWYYQQIRINITILPPFLSSYSS